MKLRTPWVLISIVAVLTTGGAGFFAQQTKPETTKDAAALRAAIDKETVQGDRKGAIEQYKKIAQSSKDRSIAVKALLQLAELYRKAGEADAEKIYQQIVRDYKDQKDAVALANAKLGTAPAAALVSRTVWKPDSAHGTVFGGRISSDGRFFSWTDRRDIFLHDIAAGEDRNLTNQPKGPLKDTAWESVISPDGKRIVYNWHDQKAGRYELRIANLTGDSAPRKFYDNPDASDMWLGAWSPDGKVVAIVLERADGTRQIGLISASDGSLKVLKTVDWQRIQLDADIMAFSPDGRYLAYDASSGARSQVLILAVDGSRESPVSEESDDQRVMGWSPDGKWLLYSSDRVGDRGIYAAAFANGAIQGAPQRLAPGMTLSNLTPLGVSSSGTLFYEIASQNYVTGIGLGSVDYSSGRFSIGELASTREYALGSFKWSPDGKSFAYGSFPSPHDGEQILVRSIEQTGSVRLVRPMGFRGLILPLRWIPGSRSVLVSGSDANSGKSGLYRVDTETGEVSPVPEMLGADFFPRSAAVLPDGESFLIRIATGSKTGVYRVNARTGERSTVFIDADGEASINLNLSSDGNRLFMIRGFEQKSNRVAGSVETGPTALIVRDLRAGSEKELVRLPRLSGPSVSGDGRNAVTTSVDTTSNTLSLVTVPSTGGAARELMRVVYHQPGSAEGIALEETLIVLGWTPDNHSILVCKSTSEIRAGRPSVPRGSELWMVPIAEGEPRKIEGSVPADANLSEMVISPDRVHFLLPIVRSEPPSFAFSALENFLPKVTSASK